MLDYWMNLTLEHKVIIFVGVFWVFVLVVIVLTPAGYEPPKKKVSMHPYKDWK